MDTSPSEHLLLHQSVERQAEQNGSAVAVDDGSRKISYAELAEEMARLASLLIGAGVRRGDRVAVLIDNSVEACIALLGILRADACFVALNHAWPALRIAAILEDARPAAVIGVGALWPLLSEAVNEARALDLRALVCLDALTESVPGVAGRDDLRQITQGRDAVDRADPIPPPCQNTGEDLAYILFTSGTTGKPKGVMIPHRAILSTIEWGCRYFNFGPTDRLANHSRLSFDACIFDIFCAFFSGAAVCPLTKPGDCAFPGDFIRRQRITVWFSVPSVIGMMLKARQLSAGPFTHLRAALFGGEALPAEMVSAWRTHQPHVPIYNLYGPTEAAIACTCHEIGVDSPFLPDRPIPIGRQIGKHRLLVLHVDADIEAPANEVGRLMICGPHVGAGYWGRTDLTEASFRHNTVVPAIGDRMYDTGDLVVRDDAGIFHFVGRADTQVKIRGFRIELGEIEVALGACPGVEAAAAFVVGENGERRIVAAVVGTETDDDTVFAELERRLPSYMMPGKILFLESLPRNTHGKVDRARLAEMV